jgi:hypothetical protein
MATLEERYKKIPLLEGQDIDTEALKKRMEERKVFEAEREEAKKLKKLERKWKRQGREGETLDKFIAREKARTANRKAKRHKRLGVPPKKPIDGMLSGGKVYSNSTRKSQYKAG